MLVAQNVKKSYGELQVLKGIDIQVEKGEIVSIVGASGAGKSTLLQILGTLDTPDQGTVTIMGTDITKLSSKQLANFRNRHIGFVFQFHNLLPEFSALENVCIPGYLSSKHKEKQVEERGKYLMEKLGIGHRLNHKPNQMSGGEQQRTAIARALLNEPDIIFADEPTGNLDSKNAGELHELFLKLKEEFNQTFVIVTHNESLAKSADRRLVMNDGHWVL